MARRKKDNRRERPKRQPGLLDKVPMIAGAAAAVGISAAVLSRKSSLLSDSINKATHALGEAAIQLQKTRFRDFNIDTAKSAINKFVSSYQDYTAKYNPINKNSLGSVFSNLAKVKTTATKLIKEESLTESIDELAHRFKTGDSVLDKRRFSVLNSFLRKDTKALYNPNTDALYRFRKSATNKLGANGLFNESEIADITNEAIEMSSMLLRKTSDDVEENLGRVTEYKGTLKSLKKYEKSLVDGSFRTKLDTLTDQLQNAFLDIDSLEKRYGSSSISTAKNTFAKDILDNDPLTLKQLSDRYKNNDKNIAHNSFMDKAVRQIDELLSGENGERYGNLYWDKTLRIDKNGDIQNYSGINSIARKAKSFYDETIVAKVLKLDEFINHDTSPLIISHAGSFNPVLEKLINKDSTSTHLTKTFLSINGQSFTYDGGELNRLSELDDTLKHVSKNSVAGKSIEKMFGADYDTGRTRGGILDLHESNKMNPLESAVSFFTKFKDPRYARNEAKNVFSTIDTDSLNFDDIENLYGQYSDINKILQSNYDALDKVSATKLYDALSSMAGDDQVDQIRQYLHILTEDNESMVSSLTSLASGDLSEKTLVSSKLSKELSILKSDPAKYLTSNHTDTNFIPGMSREAISAYDILRRGVTDEAMMRLSMMNTVDEDASSFISHVLGNGTAAADKAINALYSSEFNNALTDFTNQSTESLQDSYSNAIKHVNAILQNNQQEKDKLFDLVNSNVSLLQSGFNDKEYFENEYSDNLFIPKGTNPLDIIRSLNDSEKFKSTTQQFGKQFIAGTNNPEDITTATYGPFFFANRLLAGFERYGLGFSADAYKSTGSLAANIMLKRILPVAGALYGLSYLNFETDNFTGSSLGEQFTSGIANVDLGIRRITDATGLTRTLRDLSVSNPIFSYWGNEQEYQGYDERKEWYEDGYSPVRSGRWWSFGSSSEFRGGKISYFAPNYLRRISSNYYDVSVYGSSDEKWKHSWIPTPRHPFSTLTALSNPYWLEEKHYEDRPYPVSGKLFSEGTPWGAVLNPTIGNLIKPQKRMHQDVLQGTTIDVRALIRKYNEDEKQKADANSYVQIGGYNGISSVKRPESSYGVPGEGFTPDYDVYYDTSNTAYYTPASGNETGTAIYDNSSMSNMTGYYGQIASDISAYDKLRASSNPIAFAASRVIPLDQIATINRATKQKSRNKISGYAPSGFIQDNNAYYTEGGPSFDPLAKQFDQNDFIESRSVEEWLRDASYSAKELGGIYGFALDLVFPAKHKYTEANAGEMTSFSGRFWDENVGGYGGDIMEIARRFFPHEDHSVTKINNIQNTMPEWIPERFRVGNAYASLPKGDMRLPGPGYETLNELHPDEYGQYYGSFDRFKILADIAPWSQEYKQWHRIVKQQNFSPEMQDEIKEIEDRVKRQNSRHTFYNKNYAIETEDINGIVSEVGKDNTFKLYGSDKVYSVAGVDLRSGQELSQFLTAGSDVRLTVDKKDLNKDVTGAIVYDYSNSGANVTKSIVEADAGTINRDTPIGVQAYSDGFSVLNALGESVAHAPIPFIHNKFLRVNTPMEAWEEEELYGTSYSTWNHPIEGFVKPAIRKTMAMTPVAIAANVALTGLSKYLDSTDANDLIKAGAKSAEALTNPLAFAGGMASSLLTMNTKYTKLGVDIGEAVGLGVLAYKSADNPILSTITGIAIGATFGAQFFKTSNVKGAQVGALVGLGISALKNAYFDKDEMFGDYIPEDAQKRWDLQEYFDRLKYIKYSGLYKEAARQAKEKEGIDIESILNSMEYAEEENKELQQKLLKYRDNIQKNSFLSYPERREALSNIDDRLAQIKYSNDAVVIEGGEYTKAAIAYKKAAESTIYGLQEDANWSEILRALPKNHRDFFMEFAKETDEKKRNEIRSKVSDYEGKVLDLVWHEKKSKIEDNTEYFTDHYLPNISWVGWKPDTSLDNVQMKTIENEGMMLSDFGFYDSNLKEYDAQNTPGIDNYRQESSALMTRANLITSMNGLGLFNVDVSLTPTRKPGLNIISEITRINAYKAKEKINQELGFRAVY